jgi:predicted nucleic acid-binding protein
MNLFIDSNIFLGFYGYSDDSLEELNKLVLLIEEGEIILYIPEQVKDEVERKREEKIKEAYKNFIGSRIEKGFPYIFRLHKDFPELLKTVKGFYVVKERILKELKIDIKDKKLKADLIIKKLFSKGKSFRSDKYIDIARIRMELGNPPGKKGSLGDAINWECLLNNVPKKNDLFFISKDSDFQSPLNTDQFNSFLFEEWQVKKNSKIFLYQSLTEWARKHQKDMALRLEDEKGTLIDCLLASNTFAETHLIIKNLSKYQDFSMPQIEQIMSAGTFNSQVNWIFSDEDVKKFYTDLITKCDEKELNPEVLAIIKKSILDEPSD